MPDDIYVVIENPGGSSVKYEVDKESLVPSSLIASLFTSMSYPAAYGLSPGRWRRR